MNDLVEKVCKNTKFNIPECMIEEYVKDMKARSEAQAAAYKIPFEMFLQFQGLNEETFKARTRETAENRLNVYSSQTQPLLDFYAERGLLVEINGDQAVRKVFEDIVEKLGE